MLFGWVMNKSRWSEMWPWPLKVFCIHGKGQSGHKNILKIFSYLSGQNVKIFYFFLHASAQILIFLCPPFAGERCFMFKGQISSEHCLGCLLFFCLVVDTKRYNIFSCPCSNKNIHGNTSRMQISLKRERFMSNSGYKRAKCKLFWDTQMAPAGRSLGVMRSSLRSHWRILYSLKTIV